MRRIVYNTFKDIRASLRHFVVPFLMNQAIYDDAFLMNQALKDFDKLANKSAALKDLGGYGKSSQVSMVLCTLVVCSILFTTVLQNDTITDVALPLGLRFL